MAQLLSKISYSPHHAHFENNVFFIHLVNGITISKKISYISRNERQHYYIYSTIMCETNVLKQVGLVNTPENFN